MNRVHLLAACGAFISAMPVDAAPVASPAPLIEKDTQCLLLYLAAAADGTDQKVQQAAIAGSWYFLGRLDVRAPGLDLVKELRSKEEALRADPKAKDIGAACDSELSKRGAELVDTGKQLQNSD